MRNSFEGFMQETDIAETLKHLTHIYDKT